MDLLHLLVASFGADPNAETRAAKGAWTPLEAACEVRGCAQRANGSTSHGGERKEKVAHL